MRFPTSYTDTVSKLLSTSWKNSKTGCGDLGGGCIISRVVYLQCDRPCFDVSLAVRVYRWGGVGPVVRGNGGVVRLLSVWAFVHYFLGLLVFFGSRAEQLGLLA